MKGIVRYDSYTTNSKIINEIINNKKVMDTFRQDIVVENNVLEELDRLNSLDKNSNEYKELYNKVIQVGEYNI